MLLQGVSNMAITVFQSTLSLSFVEEESGDADRLHDVIDNLRHEFDMTADKLQLRISAAHQKVILNRLWDKSYMIKAGLLESLGRGLTKLTQRHLDSLSQTEQPTRINYLNKFLEFLAFKKNQTDNTSTSTIAEFDRENQSTPEKRSKITYNKHKETLPNELLDNIKKWLSCILPTTLCRFDDIDGLYLTLKIY